MDPLSIIEKYYPADDALRRLLLRHSNDVCARALSIVDRHPELGADRRLVEQGAMLHDIGIFRTDAPGIHCHGTEPYLMHGYIGAQLMRSEGLDDIARICERHTGTGLTASHIAQLKLPLPPGDYVPERIEEQIVCYADKFFSKSHPDRRRTIERTAQSLEKFGLEGVVVFKRWAELFEPERLQTERDGRN